MRFIPERIDEWAYWICEREAVRKKKEDLNCKPPYTKDPVIANNRFTNVRRMDDKLSKWMLKNWYLPDGYARYDTALIAGLLARMINRQETLTAITGGKHFTKFDYDAAYTAMYKIKDSGRPVFTSVYIINGASGGPKIDQVLNAIRDCARVCDKRASRFIVTNSMQQTAKRLNSLRGVGGFISGQVVADLRHVLGGANWWGDRMTWAPPGPGSSRGMKYLLGQASPEDMAGRGNDLSEKQFLPALRDLIELARINKKVGPIFKERKLEAHDIQNTLCELGKFVRVKYGTGRAKNAYSAEASYYQQLEL